MWMIGSSGDEKWEGVKIYKILYLFIHASEQVYHFEAIQEEKETFVKSTHRV